VGNENAKAWRALRGMLFKNYHNAPNASNEETPMGDDASALFDSLKRMQLDAENKRQAHDFGQKEGKKEKYGKPPLTDVDILRSMQTLYPKDSQVCACLNFLAFRNRITPILIHCAERLLKTGITLTEEMLGKPDELLRFVEVIFHIKEVMPDVWSELARDIAELIKRVIYKYGRKELDAADKICGFVLEE
jgi:hypothetical protein